MANKQVLKQCNVFSGLSSVEIDRIADLAVAKEYEAGAVMFQEKDRAEELFILEEGKVALQISSPVPPGRKVTVDVASSGEVVAWAPLIEPRIHDSTAICLQKSKVLAIDVARLHSLLRDENTSSKIMLGLVQAVVSRLNDTRHLLVSERFWPQRIE
ncbi:MAG: cyclic nucleotide-binding domain-containing protein [Dehalococcoidales bacterium]|nr:cyclic nucleotide-binding domain-containing protein [Dehalococcoidales bacterium]